MNKILINGFGDPELLNAFVKAWGESEKTPEKKKDIYISSPGGHVDVFQTITDIINSCPEQCNLIAVGEIHSAAFELFYSVKCERRILPFTFGMYHFAYDEILIDEHGKAKEEYGKARLENLKLMRSHTFKFCRKIGMSDKEIKSIKAGKDVYFQAARLQQFLQFQNSK